MYGSLCRGNMCMVKTPDVACIGESVDSLCRDDTDTPIALNASKLSNAWILRLFG